MEGIKSGVRNSAWLTVFIFSACPRASNWMAWKSVASEYRTSARRPESSPERLAFQSLRDQGSNHLMAFTSPFFALKSL